MPRNYKIHIIAFVIFAILTMPLNAQKDSINVYGYNLLELSKIEVSTGSKISQKTSEVPATMRVITKQKIKEEGYFTLEDVLADLPGFQFRNIQGFNSYIFQRGIPNQNNLILLLIDGIQVNELNSGGFYGGGQYNLENIERIEVVYGPASVTYGTNAVSGVINLITKKDDSFSASVLSGNFKTFNANFNCGFKKDSFGIRFSGMYKTSEKLNLNNTENETYWTKQAENFEDDYSFDTKVWYKNLTAGINFMNKQASRTTNYPSLGTIYRDYGSLWNIAFTNAYIKYKHSFSKNLKLLTNIYNRNATVRNNTIGYITDTSQVGYYRPNHLLGAESILSFSYKNKLKVISGIDYEYEQIASGFAKTFSTSQDEAPPVPEKPEMLQTNLLSLFIESQFKILNNLSAVGGLRLDYSTVYKKAVTPRAGLVFNQNNFNAKLLYSEAYRAPKPWDYTSGIGNPDLLPEQIKSFELSNILFLSSNFFISLSLYKNIINGAISKEVVDAWNSYKWVNKGKIETDGIELEIKYGFGFLNLFANYTYNNSYDENKEIVPEIAKHTANMGFSYSIFNNLRLNLKANYLGERINPWLIAATGDKIIKPVSIFNGVLSYDYKKMNVKFIAKNIFDTEYYHSSNTSVDRYLQPQRTLLLKVSYYFNK